MIINGIFLLLLAISGNFVGDTVGCNLKKLLKENQYVIQFIVIGMIYFVITFSSDSSEETIPFMDHIKLTVIIYILWCMFTRLGYKITILVTLLLFIHYIIHVYIFNKENKLNEEEVKDFHSKNKILLYLISILIIIGYIFHFKTNYIDNKKKFSIKNIFKYNC